MFFIRLLSRLPLSALYLLADFLFFVAYHLVRYRRDIVWKNLERCFPNKGTSELKKIERDFYGNLADTAVETIKLLTISERDLLKHVKIDNTVTLKCKELGYDVFGMTSHFCNWEWFLVASSNQLGLKLHAVYKRLRSPFFNHLMIAIRSRFGVVLHEKDEILRDILKLRGTGFLMSMVADQRPFSGENKYWSTFLNQDAAFYSGTELLARRRDIKVVYAAMKRVKRGYYEVHFEELEFSPKNTKPNEITEKFIRRAEQDILKDPASYLWSHDRWKHKKTNK